MTQWFYSRDGHKLGPVDTASLKRLVVSGELAPTDLIWREGLEKWVPAARVKGLFPAAMPPNANPRAEDVPPVVRGQGQGRPPAGHPAPAGVGIRTHPVMPRRMGDSARGLRRAYGLWVACVITGLLSSTMFYAGVKLSGEATGEWMRQDFKDRQQEMEREMARRQGEPSAYRGQLESTEKTPDHPTPRARPQFWFYFGLLAAVLDGVAILTGGVCYCVMLHRLWAQVQDGQARATPGQAVGYLFVPFYNFYWAFVATVGLCNELNRCVRGRGLEVRPANSRIMLTSYAFTLGSFVPFIGIPVAVINTGLAIAAFRSATRVAVGLAEHG